MSPLPGTRVPRMPNESHREIEHSAAESAKPRRIHSARTRAKIAHTRAEQERQKKEQRERERREKLPSTFPTLSDEMRHAITERDGLMCRSCGEDGPDLKVHSFLNGLDDLNALQRDPELHAVMCSFCRGVADTIEARSIASMLRSRW